MADTAVRVITQAESWKQEVREDVVVRLRELLAMAESGEIKGIAYAATTADNAVITGYSKSENFSALVGGLSNVQFRMLKADTER